MIACRKKVIIGNNCIFDPRVIIYGHDHEFGIEGVSSHSYKFGSVVIEDGVWVGAGIIILRGTHIGTGSVIGAGIIISEEIPAYSIVKSNRELEIIKMNR